MDSQQCANRTHLESKVRQQKIKYLNQMMSVPRSVLPSNPQRNQRLQYPVYGEFGYQEPVGRKKYENKHSPIHQIIFNHQLPSGNNSARYHQTIINNPQFIRNNSYHSSSRENSSALGFHSQNYSPQTKRGGGGGGYPPQKERAKHYGFERQLSDRSGKIEQFARVHHPRQYEPEGQYSSLIDSRINEYRQYPSKKDSLDLLLNPLKGYEQNSPKSKEKALDNLIRHRARNPTFLNSQV